MSNMGGTLYGGQTGLVTKMNPAAEKLLGGRSKNCAEKMHDVTHYKHPDGSPFPPRNALA
jgi:hypothetical protein